MFRGFRFYVGTHKEIKVEVLNGRCLMVEVLISREVTKMVLYLLYKL